VERCAVRERAAESGGVGREQGDRRERQHQHPRGDQRRNDSRAVELERQLRRRASRIGERDRLATPCLFHHDDESDQRPVILVLSDGKDSGLFDFSQSPISQAEIIDRARLDAVMIYAQKGHGRRSNLYTDYTFAVKDGDKLVGFTKAYSGLTDKEFSQVDNFVKRNSLEKFGPVRTVKPELVFEIAFEGIAASNRHKSGVALRFPRINRWRKDKTANEINTLDDLKKMLELYGK